MKRNAKMPGVSTRRPQDAPEPARRKPAPPPAEEELPAEPEAAEDEDDEDEEESQAEHHEVDESHGADDALGLYLREMGAIPLLNRDQELTLAKRLEHTRERYRHAALLCPGILQRLHATFARIHQGQFHIDPTIES